MCSDADSRGLSRRQRQALARFYGRDFVRAAERPGRVARHQGPGRAPAQVDRDARGARLAQGAAGRRYRSGRARGDGDRRGPRARRRNTRGCSIARWCTDLGAGRPRAGDRRARGALPSRWCSAPARTARLEVALAATAAVRPGGPRRRPARDHRRRVLAAGLERRGPQWPLAIVVACVIAYRRRRPRDGARLRRHWRAVCSGRLGRRIRRRRTVSSSPHATDVQG